MPEGEAHEQTASMSTFVSSLTTSIDSNLFPDKKVCFDITSSGKVLQIP